MSRGFGSAAFVEPRAALFSDLSDRLGFAKAVGHSLGDPAFDAEAFGELAGVERLRQRGRQQAAQVGRGAELVDAVDLDEVLVIHQMIALAPPPSSAVPWVAPFFDFDQRDFKRQPAVREHAREMHELLEHVEQRATLWAAAARDDFAPLATELHQMLGDDDRFDDQHIVRFEKDGDLIANRSERRVLNLDKLFPTDNVDAVAADALLDHCAINGVMRFQLTVEGGFHVVLVSPGRLARG